MATADEAAGARTPMGSDLAAGVEAISIDQEIVFTRYRRLVLALDGFVFYVRDTTTHPSALFGRGLFNAFSPNQAPSLTTNATQMTVKGSLHWITDTRQELEETYAANRMVFTAENAIAEFNAVDPRTLWIGTWSDPETGDTVRFAFSSQSSRYWQANLWHYQGFAVYADMASQIIDNPNGFDTVHRVVSNSLPAWLALNSYIPLVPPPLPGGMTLFPAMLVPQNEVPPFAAVNVLQDTTRGLQSTARTFRDGSRSQLAAETVRITLWGVRSDQALDFVEAVNQYSLNTDAFGIMNVPVIHDEKRGQNELNTIAQKKTVDFEISYQQTRLQQITTQIIESAKVAISVVPAAA
jgi:hypothetical protein